MTDEQPTRPTDVSGRRGRFDAVADRASTLAATPGFFLVLLVLVLGWATLGVVVGFTHAWIDVLQIVGTIVTLLLVALLENEQWRNSKATQRKLNALAEGLAHLMRSDPEAAEHARQLNAAVGLEKRESISK